VNIKNHKLIIFKKRTIISLLLILSYLLFFSLKTLAPSSYRTSISISGGSISISRTVSTSGGITSRIKITVKSEEELKTELYLNFKDEWIIARVAFVPYKASWDQVVKGYNSYKVYL